MGVAILGKDVSLISTIAGKAKANINNVGGINGWAGGGGGGGGFVAGDLAFNDYISKTSGTFTTNTQTSPKTGTLYLFFDLSNNDGVTTIDFIQNGNSVATFDLAGALIPEATISITSGDQLYFQITRSGPNFMSDSGTIYIRNLDGSGVIIDTVYIET